MLKLIHFNIMILALTFPVLGFASSFAQAQDIPFSWKTCANHKKRGCLCARSNYFQCDGVNSCEPLGEPMLVNPKDPWVKHPPASLNPPPKPDPACPVLLDF
jgi:hypothetical protein